VLSLDALVSGLKDVCAGCSDKRKGGDAVHAMADIRGPACSLAPRRELEEARKSSTCRTLSGMAKIPTDNHIRSMLDPVAPSLLHPSFDQALALLRTRGGLKAFERLNGRARRARWNRIFLLAKDRLSAVPHRQARKRQNRELSFHVGGAPGRAGPHHGAAADAGIHRQKGRAEKQDGERNAAKRRLSVHGERIMANGSWRTDHGERMKCKSLDLIHRATSDYAIHLTAEIIGEAGSVLSRM
jgi:hypothetical protein